MNRGFVGEVPGGPTPVVKASQVIVVNGDSGSDVTELPAQAFCTLVDRNYFDSAGFHIVQNGNEIRFVELRSTTSSSVDNFMEGKDPPLLLGYGSVDDGLHFGHRNACVDVVGRKLIGEAFGGNQAGGNGAMPLVIGANFCKHLRVVFTVGRNKGGNCSTKVCGDVGLGIAYFRGHCGIVQRS